MNINDIIKDENVRKFGKSYIDQIIQELRSAGKDTTGKLIKSFSQEIKKEAEQINIIISSEDYLEYIDQGRKPGTWPNLQAIKDWARTRNLSDYAFPIARNIFKFGIRPTNVLDKAKQASFTSSSFSVFEQDIANNVETEYIKNLDLEIDEEI